MTDLPKDSLGDRMKMYESASRTQLPRRMPLILRIDGRAFHTYTRGLAKPFDSNLMAAMNATAVSVCSEVQGAQLGYVQSDEISVLVHNYKRFSSSAWFDNSIQKMVSVAAGIASAAFTVQSSSVFGTVRPAVFDARVFALPEAEVCNYFIWRQQDTIRNGVQMMARAKFSHSACENQSVPQLVGMLRDAGVEWDDADWACRYGRATTYSVFGGYEHPRWHTEQAPLFTGDRDFVNNLLAVEEP